MKFGLSDKVMHKLFGFFTAIPEVDEVIIYGSRAIGTYYDGSDIDLTLKGDALNYDLLRRIRLRLHDLNLPYFIDISIYRDIKNPDLVRNIDLFGKTLYLDKRLMDGSWD